MADPRRGPVRVLVIDDQPMFADAVRALLETHPDITVVGCAENGARGLELAEALEPDVALVDVVMPGGDGLEITRQLRRAHPDLRVVVVSGVGGDTIAAQATDAGASAFLLKGNLHEEIAQAIVAA